MGMRLVRRALVFAAAISISAFAQDPKKDPEQIGSREVAKASPYPPALKRSDPKFAKWSAAGLRGPLGEYTVGRKESRPCLCTGG